MADYIEFLRETFERWGEIEDRKMFGGYGIYHRGVMFALVADETLYLKSKITQEKEFESKGLAPFQYDKKGKTVKMSYRMAPEEIFDDRDEAALWAERSFAAAIKGKKRKAKKRD